MLEVGGGSDSSSTTDDRRPGHRHRSARCAMPQSRTTCAHRWHRRRRRDPERRATSSGRECRVRHRVHFCAHALPRCDAVDRLVRTASHSNANSESGALRRVRMALRPGGVLVSVDCQPAADPHVARRQSDDWNRHLRRAYTPAKSAALLAAWRKEDVYVPLDEEIDLMQPQRLPRRGDLAERIVRGAERPVAC